MREANLDRRASLETLHDWVRRALSSARRRDLVEGAAQTALSGRRSRARIGKRALTHARTLSRGDIHLDS
jgi:hypothetical protein